MDEFEHRKVIIELVGVGLAAFKANSSTAVALRWVAAAGLSEEIRTAVVEECDALQAHNKELYERLEAVIAILDGDRGRREDAK